MYLWSYFVLLIFNQCFSNADSVNNTNVSDESSTPRGMYPAIFTPFTNDGKLNMTAITLYARNLKKIGVDGVLVSGTNGEGPNLSVCERKALIKAWVKEAKKYGYKVLAQIGGAAIADILDLAQFAVKVKVDSILVLPTLYYDPKTVEELVKLIKMVSNAAPSLPLLYYDIPMMSNVKLNMPQFFKMASKEIPSFKGIKTELQTAVRVKAANKLRSDQTILISNGILLSGAVLQGYDTFATTLLNLYPNLVYNVINYTKSGEMIKAREAQEKLNKITGAITADFDTIPSFKAAAKICLGIDFGSPRPPLNPVTKEGQQKIRRILQENDIKTV